MLKEKIKKFTNPIFNNPSFTLKEQLGYSGGIFGNCMAQDSFGTYADVFDRDYMGIENSKLTLLGNASTILSFVAPPVAGTILDRPTEPGKLSNAKKVLKYIPIPFAISSMLAFVVPSASSLVNFIWVFIVSLLFDICDSFYDISLSTISLRMTTNPADRKNFYTISSLASSLGSALPGWIIPIFVDRAKTANGEKWTYFAIALVFCVIGVSSMYAPFFTLNEKVGVNIKQSDDAPEKINWNKDLIIAILRNRPFIILEISCLFDGVRQVTYKLLPYLYKNTFADYSMKAIIDVISGVLSYIGLFAVPIVGEKVSARNIMAGGYGYTAFFYAIMSLFNINFNLSWIQKYRYIIGVLIGISGMPNTALSAARKIITADSTDYMEWYTEKKFGTPVRSDGMLCAAQSVINKGINLFKTNLYYLLFGLTKYKEGGTGADGKAIEVTQSNYTLRGIFAVATLCGLVGSLLPSITFLFDNYTGKRKEAIFAELCEMREARAKKAAEFTDDSSV